MSLPDPAPPRKLSRLGLYIPFGLLLVFIVVISVAWILARGEAVKRMDAGAEMHGRECGLHGGFGPG